MDIKKKLRNLPKTAGVYIMKSAKGEILYVGKAASLKSRVSSYFTGYKSAKTEKLVDKIADIDFIECQSPQQALILEAALIKEKKPKYNISLRDNKSYPYIEITKEKFPRIFISRPKKKTNSILFGPYPAAQSLKPALETIRRIFPYCSCRRYPKKPCLFYHLNLCPGPCAGKVSVADYKENIDNICKILRGERKELIKKLKKQMQQLAKEKKFEAAAKLRDKLAAVESLYAGRPRQHQLLSLKEILSLPRIPLHIEAIDISSLGRFDSVGSLVVFKDGIADKSLYRRFLIRQANKKDDYAMIEEVARRRYSRLQRESKQMPDLIIVDGGLGQVNKASKVLKELKLSIPVIGIAKRNEEVWFPGKDIPLRIPKSSPCLHLIQRVRDEAHRFAHNYQLIRRKKKMGL